MAEHEWLAVFFPSPNGLMNRYNWVFGLHKLSVESLSAGSLEESQEILESHPSVDSLFFIVDELSMFPGENYRGDAVKFLKEYDRLYLANPEKQIWEEIMPMFLELMNDRRPRRCYTWF